MLELGFTERIVTPPAGIWLGGFASRTEPAKGIRDDLRAQIIWLRDSERDNDYVMIVLDQVGITRGWTDALQVRLRERWGLQEEQVLVHWTHSHCAPLYRDPTPGFEQAVFPADYFAELIGVVVEACGDARADLESVSFRYGSGSCDMAVSRRLIVDGQNTFAANPFGTVDHDVPVVEVRRADDSRKLVLFSYACHPTMTNDLYVSAEYPGVARRVLEARLPGAHAVFMQGCGADAIVGVMSSEKERYQLPDQWADMEAAGRQLAWKVLLTLAHRMEPLSGDSMCAITHSVYPTFEHHPTRAELEARASDGDHPGDIRWARWQLTRFSYPEEPVWPAHVEARLHGLRIGDLYLVAHPGEVTAAYGLRLKERHPQHRLMTLAYSHAQIGYIPRRSMYDEGGYEVDAWRTWGYPSRWNRSIEQQFESAAELILSELSARC